MGPLFHNDEPTLDDRLGYGDYAAALTDLCRRCRPPFVVGVHGGWGVGKTSLLRAVEARLLACGAPAVATVWFNPWHYQFEESPVVALLQEVAASLADTRPGHGEGLKLLNLVGTLGGELLLKAVTGGKLSVHDVAGHGVAWEEQYFAVKSVARRLREAFREDVARLLAARHADRLVVLIDDLDRCLGAQALHVLESLKIFLNATNCVYLLGLDPVRLTAALREGGLGSDAPDAAPAYLDKVVQLPFYIPRPSAERLAAWVGELLPDDYDPALTRLVALGVGDNPRSLKRFINAALLWEPVLRARLGSVYAPSLHLRLRLIQHHSPARYEAVTRDGGLLGDVLLVLRGLRSIESFDPPRAAELRRWADDPTLAAILRADPPLDADAVAALAAYVPLVAAPAPAEPAPPRWKPALLGLADGTERALLIRDVPANVGIPADVHLGRLPSLSGVDLRGADLRDADLYQADLRLADLRRADLRGAMLARANLDGALLGGADLAEAEMDDVVWPEGFAAEG